MSCHDLQENQKESQALAKLRAEHATHLQELKSEHAAQLRTALAEYHKQAQAQAGNSDRMHEDLLAVRTQLAEARSINENLYREQHAV